MDYEKGLSRILQVALVGCSAFILYMIIDSDLSDVVKSFTGEYGEAQRWFLYLLLGVMIAGFLAPGKISRFVMRGVFLFLEWLLEGFRK